MYPMNPHGQGINNNSNNNNNNFDHHQLQQIILNNNNVINNNNDDDVEEEDEYNVPNGLSSSSSSAVSQQLMLNHHHHHQYSSSASASSSSYSEFDYLRRGEVENFIPSMNEMQQQQQQQQQAAPTQINAAAAAAASLEAEILNAQWYPINPVNNTIIQQQQQQQQYPSYNYVAPSNSREMRNRAEKQRRDRLNAFISQLAELVPIVSKSAKRLDKTSILRLAATHLRIYQLLVKAKGAPHMALPPRVDQFVLEQLICDQLGGFLLIITPTGKIIFISHTVESLLGHLQTDLMGQSLFSVTAPEDQKKLTNYLSSDGPMEKHWRTYFSIKVRRAGPKSEPPHYENLNLMGMQRNLANPDGGETSTSSSASASASPSPLQTPITTDILIFFCKITRPQPLLDRLIVAAEEKYVTRHLVDGSIIYSDQRISLVAGYMIDEVQGNSAFQYMHREDVHFVLVALRQMYDRYDREETRYSCYRLQTRNGQFVFLRTYAFLEMDRHGVVESFTCVNVLVDEKEGVHHLQRMKNRFSAIYGRITTEMTRTLLGMEPIPATAENVDFASVNWKNKDPKIGETEDPERLQNAITTMMQSLPAAELETQKVNFVANSSSSSSSISSTTPKVTSTNFCINKDPNNKSKRENEHNNKRRLQSVDSDSSSSVLSPSCSYQDLSGPEHFLKKPKLEDQYSTVSSSKSRKTTTNHSST